MIDRAQLRDVAIKYAIGLYDTIGSVLWKRRPVSELNSPHRITLILLHQIGDFVLSTPTIQAIRAMFPDAELSLIINPSYESLLSKNSWNASIYPISALWQRANREQLGKTKNPAEIANARALFKKCLKELNPDLVVNFHPNLFVNQALGALKPPCSVGFSDDGGGFWLTHPLSMPSAGHQTARNYALVKTVGKIYKKPIPTQCSPIIPVQTDAEQSVNALLKAQHIQPNRLIAIHPFSSTNTREWQWQHWRTIITTLINEGHWQPIIIGGQRDHFPDLPTGAFDLSGKLSLSETVALLSVAHMFIGIDSGPGHLAAAVSTPVISVFSGVNDPKQWAPAGPDVIVLHRPPADRQRFPLRRFELPPGTEGNPYLDNVTPTDVLQAFRSLARD